MVEIQPRDRRRFKRLLEERKSFESLPIRTKLTDEEVARFTAQRFRFPGVDIKARLFRNYPLGELGQPRDRLHRPHQPGREEGRWRTGPKSEQANYRGTEYIGKLGVEQSYENELHGITGFEEVETSRRRPRRAPAGAATRPTPGNTLMLSIDIKLQTLVEDMFGDRRGALVAIDPRTGEVLAFVSKPTFDPNLFVDGIDRESWQQLNESIDKPLLNRALRGTYPPGSTFKPFMAMAALQHRQAHAAAGDQRPRLLQLRQPPLPQPRRRRPGAVDMYRVDRQVEQHLLLLAGQRHGRRPDARLHEAARLRPARPASTSTARCAACCPSTAWKRKAYKQPEQQKWYAGETISLGIGQGYNSFTMLQLASATATLVNGGQRYKPHLVRAIEDVDHARAPSCVASDAARAAAASSPSTWR